MNVPLKLILCFLIISIITYFFTWGPILHLTLSFLGKWLAGSSRYFQFLNSTMLLSYKYYSFSIIYFVILSFPCFIKLVLIALRELLWAYLLMLGHFAAYFGQFFTFH